MSRAAPRRGGDGAPGDARCAPLPAPVDPVFALPRGGALLPVVPCHDDAARALLAGRIVRDPLDVESHARRVVLACHRGRADDAASALADLFLATGARVRELRAALLDHARAHLDDEVAAFLDAALDGGLAADASLPMGLRARLDLGLVGDPRLVVKADAPPPREVPVDAEPAHARAAALIDQGDVDAARRLLEDAVLADPHDDVATRELLAIYRHGRDAAAHAAMRRRLAERGERVPAAWA